MTDGEVKDDGKKKEVTKGDGEVILKEIVVPPVPDKEGTLSRQKEIQKEIQAIRGPSFLLHSILFVRKT